MILKRGFFLLNFEKKIVMITLSKLKGVAIEQGQRILKVMQYGPKTANECGPFGLDSSPLENYTAIYAETANAGESLIIGYIQKNQIAQQGEARLFSLDSNGLLKAEIFCKADGTIILNGGVNSSIRYEPLNTELQKLKSDINTELLRIQTAVTTLGGTYANAPLNLDLTTAKSDTIKIK
mgnify:CR=1 FL=1